MRHKHIVNINLCKLLIMKKFFNFSPYCIGLLASGLLLLSGCSQEENGFSPSSSRAISFRAQGGQDGLKATTTSSAYISSFVVNAHQSDAPDWNTYLLKGTTVYRGEGGGNNWAYAPAAYFPEGAADGDYVEFFAYSPSGSSRVTSGLSSATTADQQITYSVPAPDLNDTKGNTTQEDLLVSYGKVLKADYDKSVNLQFRHALSRVLVSAINNTASDVTITGLKLVNLKPSGTLKLTGNTKDSSEKSDGIPWSASAVEATNPTSWVYSPTTPTATTDYVTLWDASGTLTDYPYILPESGVSVSGTEKLVTSVEQGMYVLPQTAAGNGNGTWESGEFGLEVAYTRSGLAQQGKTIAFKDINGIPSTEVTFEIGRQYILHIEIDGTGISFGDITVDNYDTPGIVVPKPNKWAGSNIYFKASGAEDADGVTEGYLTFDEHKGDKEGYQGLYFNWGSLVGTAAGPNEEAWSTTNTYVYIPDLATGKYYKVKTGAVTALKTTATTPAGNIVKAFANTSISGNTWNNGSWGSIPYADNADIDASAGSRDDYRLTTQTASLQASYKGDICKFLTLTKPTNGNSFKKNWRMPVSNDFGAVASYPAWVEQTTVAGTEDGVGGVFSISPYSYTDATFFYASETVLFPATGCRGDAAGKLTNVGVRNSMYSASTGTFGAYVYYLNANSGYTNTADQGQRNSAQGVRCVRE